VSGLRFAVLAVSTLLYSFSICTVLRIGTIPPDAGGFIASLSASLSCQFDCCIASKSSYPGITV
jgi:hypothetical protein